MPAFRSGLFCLLGRSSGDLDEVILVVPHAKLLHVSKLPQAMARFNALNEVVTLILGARLNEIHRRLIDCENNCQFLDCKQPNLCVGSGFSGCSHKNWHLLRPSLSIHIH